MKTGIFNDLWKYNIAAKTWTWIHGTNLPNGVGEKTRIIPFVDFVSGYYGTKGIGTATTTPGARSAVSFWTDQNGKFWLFGGGCARFLVFFLKLELIN